MKRLLFLTLILSFTHGISQPLNRSFKNSDGSLKLLGQISVDRLSDEPFAVWYDENRAAYKPNLEELATVQLPDSITVFMGTWCGDSRREVPRFIKILEEQKYDLNRLKIVCLNSGFQNYKQAPDREERGANIHRVPTFIFHDEQGVELGRIVEEPISTLERDMGVILSGGDYQTAYPIAEKMIASFNSSSLMALKKKKSRLLDELSGGENPYELNTLGYVLWSSFQIPKAQFVFEINAKLFPNEAVTHRTLAQFLDSIGKKRLALSSVEKGLAMEPENERLLSLKSKINERSR